MSIREQIRQTAKRILTKRYDLKYDRVYCRGLKHSGYTVLIGELEEKQWREVQKQIQGKTLPSVVVVRYKWSEKLSPAQILKKAEESAGKKIVEHTGGRAEKVTGDIPDIVCLVDDRVELSAHVKELIGCWFVQHPETELLYGDEDVLAEDGSRIAPWLKPEWSPLLFEQLFYWGGVVCVRRELLEQTGAGAEDGEQASGGKAVYGQKNAGAWMPALAGSWIKLSEGLGRSTEKAAIGHIPAILCHHGNQADYETYRLNLRREDGEDSSLSYRQKISCYSGQLISIVIPSKDHAEILERNLRSLLQTTRHVNMEILIVDNGSEEAQRHRVEKLRRELILKAMEEKEAGQRGTFTIRYLYDPMPFHFSKMCNIGAQAAEGDLLLFLNDDTEALEEGWLAEMAAVSLRPYVGAVGAKLLYPDSVKIQHDGIVNLPLGPVHKLQFLEDTEEYYFGMNRLDRDVLAVTGACLMLRREVFMQCGGFCEELPVAFNDVDLCFTLYEQGYDNVVMNSVRLYHHESLSRGDDESPEKLSRLERERRKLYDRHPVLEGWDPFYHSWLNRMALDTRIRPALEEVLGEKAEKVTARRILPDETARIHEGLFLRIEALLQGYCQGYSFMAGDDNACYEKQLLLENEVDGEIWAVRLPGRLRQDLQENMPDQKHVGMCGFAVEIVGLPSGEYRMGVLAKNCVTRVTYINWCARKLKVQNGENNGL